MPAAADSSLVLRPLEGGDWRRLWEIDQVCFPPEIAYPMAEFRRLARGLPAFHLGAEISGKLSGFVLSLLRHRHGHIVTIDVLPAFRRCGIGTTLLRAAEAHYRKLGELEDRAIGMRLEVAAANEDAIRLYTQLGYHVAARLPHYYPRGEDGLAMEKTWIEKKTVAAPHRRG